MFPDIQLLMDGISHDTSLISISNYPYKSRKERVLVIESILNHLDSDNHADESSRRRLITTIMESNNLKDHVQAMRDTSVDNSSGFFRNIFNFVTGTPDIQARLQDIRTSAHKMDDAAFLTRLSNMARLEPLLVDTAADIIERASSCLQKAMDKKKSFILGRIQQTRENHLKRAFEQEIDTARKAALRIAHLEFLVATQDAFIVDGAT
jgi:hypothetical protein